MPERPGAWAPLATDPALGRICVPCGSAPNGGPDGPRVGLLWLVAAALAAGLAAGALWDAATIPAIFRAWPGGECLAVRPAGSCEHPPARHHTVWVDPAWAGRE